MHLEAGTGPAAVVWPHSISYYKYFALLYCGSRINKTEHPFCQLLQNQHRILTNKNGIAFPLHLQCGLLALVDINSLVYLCIWNNQVPPVFMMFLREEKNLSV